MKIKITLFLIALSLVSLVLPVPSNAQAQILNLKWRAGMAETGTEHRVGERYSLPTQGLPMAGYVATQVAQVGTVTAVVMPTLNATTRAVMVGTNEGILNYGSSTVASGTDWPFTIASGSYETFPVSTTTPKIYFRGQISTCTVRFMEK